MRKRTNSRIARPYFNELEFYYDSVYEHAFEELMGEGDRARQAAVPTIILFSAFDYNQPWYAHRYGDLLAESGAVLHIFGLLENADRDPFLAEMARESGGTFTSYSEPADVVTGITEVIAIGGDSLPITVAANDDQAIAEVVVDVVNGSSRQEVRLFSEPFEHNYPLPNTTSDLLLGVEAKARDFGGNVTIATPVMVTVKPNSTKPFLISISPQRKFQDEFRYQLRGRFFSPVAEENRVLFADGALEARVIRADKNELTIGLEEEVPSDGLVEIVSNGVSSGSFPYDFDTDNDGIIDFVEIEEGLDPEDPTDAGLDRDGDGLTNLEEIRAGSDIDRVDSDGDFTV